MQPLIDQQLKMVYEYFTCALTKKQYPAMAGVALLTKLTTSLNKKEKEHNSGTVSPRTSIDTATTLFSYKHIQNIVRKISHVF